MKEKEKPAKVRKHVILDHPLAGYVLLLLASVLISTVTVMAAGALFAEMEVNLAALLHIVLSSAVFLGLYKLWFRPEFKGTLTMKNFGEGVKILAVPILLSVALNFYDSLKAGLTAEPLEALWLGLVAGIGEEVMFRTAGISNYMRVVREEKKIPVILWFSGILFGVIHFSNLKSGAGLQITLLQVVSSFGSGLLFAAVYLRTANIWPCILSHTLIDFVCFLSADLLENTGILAGASAEIGITTLLEAAMALPMAIIAAAATSEKYRPQILAVWDERWSRRAEDGIPEK